MKRNLAALLTLGLLLCLSCGERETKLFNGKDLTGWTFHVQADSTATAEDVFGVKDGVITIAGQPFGYMITDQSFSDYKLHLEWRWPGEPSNSGIFLHAEPIDAVCAFEELKEGRFLRSAVESAEKPAGEWNTAEIVCKGNFIQAYVNGVLMNEAHFDRSEGPVALQSEGGPLEIRNVFITPLKD